MKEKIENVVRGVVFWVDLLPLILIESFGFFVKHLKVKKVLGVYHTVDAELSRNKKGERIILGSSFVSDGMDADNDSNHSIVMRGAPSYLALNKNGYFERSIKNMGATYVVEYSYIFNVEYSYYEDIWITDIFVSEDVDTEEMYADVIDINRSRRYEKAVGKQLRRNCKLMASE